MHRNSLKYRETKKKLYDYFDKERKISSLKYKIEIVKQQMKRINEETMDYDGYRSPSWEDKVQTSYNNTSYAESELIRFEEYRKQRYDECVEEINNIKQTILQIERDNAIIEYNLRFLNADIIKLLKMKYQEKKSETSIGIELNMDQSTVNKKIDYILKNIANWEAWGIK